MVAIKKLMICNYICMFMCPCACYMCLKSDQMSGSELQPRKVELMHSYLKKLDYHESLHISTKPVIIPMETSLTALIFSS